MDKDLDKEVEDILAKADKIATGITNLREENEILKDLLGSAHQLGNKYLIAWETAHLNWQELEQWVNGEEFSEEWGMMINVVRDKMIEIKRARDDH